MQIANDCMVSIYFQLTNDAGELLDHSPDGQPLVYLHGVAGILPALERELTGKAAGDSFEVRISPEEGFGYPQPDLIVQVPREALPDGSEIAVGLQVRGRSESGEREFSITAVDETSVMLDGNHPLAGIPLCFRGSIVDVRSATEDELANWVKSMEA